MKKFVIIGSLGREQCVVEHLMKYNNEIFVITDKINPALEVLVSFGLIIFKVDNLARSINYIKFINPDYIICMNEKLIMQGYQEIFKKLCKNVFMPSKNVYKLEYDKLYTQRIVSDIDSNFINERYTVNSLSELNIMYNKGYRVIRTYQDMSSSIYINNYDYELINFKKTVITVEKYINGYDFTIPCLSVVEKEPIFLQTIFDFPCKKIDGKYIKTSGMGSILLNILNEKTFNYILKARDFIKKIIKTLHNIVNTPNLFMSFQFRVDEENEKLFFIEIDVKPGEPEWINSLNILETPLSELLSNFFSFSLCQDNICEKEISNACISFATKDYPISNNIAFNPFPSKRYMKDYKIYWCNTEIETNGQLVSKGSRFFHIYVEGPNLYDKIKHLYKILYLDPEFTDLDYLPIIEINELVNKTAINSI